MSFLSALASYGIVLLAFIAVGALAIFVGITLRKRKDATQATQNGGAENGTADQTVN